MRLILTAIAAMTIGAAHAQTAEELKAIPDQVWQAMADGFRGVDGLPTRCSGNPAPFACNVGVGIDAMLNLTTGQRNVFLGAYAGKSVEDGSDDVLVGACTATPTPRTSGFVNIANKLCFWRESGERVDCPPPEPDCGK